MIEIEFAEPQISTCGCCGADMVCLQRFVSREGAAYAVYRARLARGKHERLAELAISLGDWSEDASPETRVTFAMRVWTEGSDYKLGFVDADETIWDAELLGRVLESEQARAHPLRAEIFALSDHILAVDTPIIAYLEGE